MSLDPATPLGVYIHWPFCVAKCPYCDFNSHVADGVDHPRWRAALLAELAHALDEVDGRPVDSVFLGGGTPSLMAPETVAALLARLPLAEGAEITLEANPGTVDAARFRAFAEAGVNRLSLGVQAMNDADLKALGRVHDAAQALAAVEAARAAVSRVSFDLIYARPGQTPGAWAAELDRALALGPDHLSLYQLTIEPGTAFHSLHRRGDLVLPEDEVAADLYQATRETTAAAGLPAYEISNHARPGQESRHNLIYWTGGDYIGIGPGAHERLTRGGATLARRRHRAPAVWLERVERHGHGRVAEEALTPATRAEELVMMGLRLTRGIDTALFAARAGRSLESVLDATARRDLAADGLIEETPGRLRVTERGLPVLNAVLRLLLREGAPA